MVTLAYRGFSEPLAMLKRKLSESSTALPAENSGSMWPKTTLAALNESHRLTPDNLRILQDLCREFGSQLATLLVEVDELSVATFECRCLSRLLACQTFQLPRSVARDPSDHVACKDTFREAVHSGCTTVQSQHQPPADQVAIVQHVLGESQHAGYWFKASKDGHRINHYTSAAAGVTLVHFLARSPHAAARNASLFDVVQAFQARVESVLPGMYSFLPMSSLHITIRALA